jgi:hypothetical protein
LYAEVIFYKTIFDFLTAQEVLGMVADAEGRILTFIQRQHQIILG